MPHSLHVFLFWVHVYSHGALHDEDKSIDEFFLQSEDVDAPFVPEKRLPNDRSISNGAGDGI